MIRSALRVGLGVKPFRAPLIKMMAASPRPLMMPQRSLSSDSTPSSPSPEPIKIDKPTYQLTFTCKKCDDRSSHLVSKQAYHHGTVLIQCPSCKNRHLIADHLKVFGDGPKTLEDILSQRGEKITKASLDGDLQWEPEGVDPKSLEK